ncbi:hypothetical protein DFH27DRAFT_533090 [Peziza echinospora]|nr:hypothetical protein DFH27DRAFT_533090 [Peziza echinospora]
MDTIPTEILELILHAAELSREECIANRAVCRSFSTVLTPYAFRKVCTNRMARESFDRLCSIAQSPGLAKHVIEFHYKIEELLALPSQHEVDILLDAMPMGSENAANSETSDHPELDAVQILEEIHERHQRYLKQQDILGTFYDTLSMYQSLPLFHNLRKIHVRDSKSSSPEDSEAFARAFWNIVKVMAAIPKTACPNFTTVEFDRFHYEALAPLLTKNSIERKVRLFGKERHLQVEAFMQRVLSFRINDFNGAWLSQVDVDGKTLGTLREMISNHDLPLVKLTIRENTLPKLSERWLDKETFFLWSHDSRQFETTMVALTIPPSKFANLRVLDLKANKLLNSEYFSAMLMQLPVGILEELKLDTLGFQGQTTWVNFFRLISPKLLWNDDNEVWPGAPKHWLVQRSIVEEFEGALDTLMLMDPQVVPDDLKDIVWKGLRLKKCTLKNLLNHSLFKGVTKVPDAELREYEKWMTDGLEEREYKRYSQGRNFPEWFES